MGYSLGVDLGTTYTAAAIHRDGRVEIVSLANHAATIPSVVFLKDDGTYLVGDPAERRGIAEPQRVAREFKRRLGDSTPILIGGSPLSAERLMAVVLQAVIDMVSAREGAAPDQLTITHPANWGSYKLDLLRQTAAFAGRPDARLLPEPVAAAVHYVAAERVERSGVVGVYDLGGGTFDAAVLRKTDHGFRQLGQPQGIERLGGIDFDEAVFAFVRERLGPAIEGLDREDPVVRASLARLRDECVKAKESLSTDTDTTVPVFLPNHQTEVRLTRAEFEGMIRPILGDTASALRRAIESADMTPDHLDAVLLVGGSSRIPLVAEIVSAELGRPVAVDAHPKHAIALGAARAASMPEPKGGVAPNAGSAAAAGAATTLAAPAPPAAGEPLVIAPAVDSVVASGVAPTGQGTPAPVPPAGAAPLPAPSGAPASAYVAPVAQRRGRGRFVGIMAAAVLVGAGVGGFLLLRKDSGGAAAGASATTSNPGAATTVGTSTSVPSTTAAGTPTTAPSTATTRPATRPTTTTAHATTTTSPLRCTSGSGRCAAISSIRLQDRTYVVRYRVGGFDPVIFDPGKKGDPSDHHVHFFFDTVAARNAGTNGQPPGVWEIWDRDAGGGDLVFDFFTLDNRSKYHGDGAKRLCVAVADKDHRVEVDTASCVDLPPDPAS